MGKKFFKVLAPIAFIASFFVPGAIFLSGGILGTSYIAVSFATILQGVAAISAAIGFAPEIDLGTARLLAENLVIRSDPMSIREVAFGKTARAGQVVFRKNIKNEGDTPDELLVVLRLTGYPVTALTRFWLNGTPVFAGESTTGPGAIVSGKFAGDLWVYFRTGEETTDAFPEIAALSTEWAAKTRKLRGCAAIAIRVQVTDKLEGRFEPLAEFKGAKLYDPRLDSTVPGGAGAHRYDDPSTWEWSENAALPPLLYLRGGFVNAVRIFGMGKPKEAINLENFASEANICDEQVAVKGGGTINRYTCNGLLIPGHDHKQNLLKLLSAAAATMDASTGIYHLWVGAWRAPVMTLTEADIDGVPSEVRLQLDPAEEKNIVSGAFADPLDDWQVKEYPERRIQSSIDVIGENPVTLDLPFTIDHRMAQRIAKIELMRLNAQRAFSANYWLRALALQPGDIVIQQYARYALDHTFRTHMWGVHGIDDLEGKRRLVIPMQLIEERQEWFDWDAETEEKDSPTLDDLPPVTRLNSKSSIVVSVFRRSATTPATPTGGSYDFGTQTLTPPSGWSATPPASDGNPLYTSLTIFEIVGTTGIDDTATWSAPSVLVTDGADGQPGQPGEPGQDGDDGKSSIVVTVYRRSATAPSTPTGGSYNFGTRTLTPPTNWSATPPTADGNPLYVSSAIAEVIGTTGTDSTLTWTAPAVLVTDATHVEYVFKRSAVQPATPTGNGIPSGWSDDPLGGSDPLWMSKATQNSANVTQGSWSTPVRMDAAGGSAALNVGRRMDSLFEWFGNNSQSAALSAQWSAVSLIGPVRNTAFRVADNDNTSRDLFSERITIDPAKRHRVAVWARQPSGDRRNYLLVAFYDAAGNNIQGNGGSDATGWPAKGTYHYFVSNSALATDWTLYSIEFGGPAEATIPTGAVAMSIGGLFVRDGPVGTSTTVELQDFHVIQVPDDGVVPMLDDPLIKRGASFWELGSHTSYVVGQGSNGTDVISMQAFSNSVRFYAAARRSPTRDAQVTDGMSVNVRWRARLAAAGSGGSWTQQLFAEIKVTNENGSSPATFRGASDRIWASTDTLDEWHNESATIVIRDAATVPRFMQIGMFTIDNLIGPTWEIDFLDATIGPRTFGGQDKPGLLFGTISTSDPSGTPTDGEIWIKHEA